MPEPDKFDYNTVNIKQEPQTHHQPYADQQYDQSFDMSEMLTYQQSHEPEVEQEQPQLPSQPDLREPLDDVGIHDDLAISDSDEDDQDLVEPKSENAENDNDEEGDGLWF